MPTVLEVQEQEVQKSVLANKLSPRVASKSGPEVKQFPPPLPLFHDSLIESAGADKKRRSAATTVSFVFQCILIGVSLIVPLMFTEALPTQTLLTYLVAPPPPPPPPPPAAAAVVKVVQTDVLKNGELRTPTRIPQKIQMIKEEEQPPANSAGVVGGIPGGVPGGQLGGVIGGIISSTSTNSLPPMPAPPKRIRVSSGVIQGLLIRKVEPKYPVIAATARVTGVVQLSAIIGKDGNIRELQVVSGHPLLVPAAVEAVKQWHYRPYLLNGEPVEVDTTVTVTFVLSQN